MPSKILGPRNAGLTATVEFPPTTRPSVRGGCARPCPPPLCAAPRPRPWSPGRLCGRPWRPVLRTLRTALQASLRIKDAFLHRPTRLLLYPGRIEAIRGATTLRVPLPPETSSTRIARPRRRREDSQQPISPRTCQPVLSGVISPPSPISCRDSPCAHQNRWASCSSSRVLTEVEVLTELLLLQQGSHSIPRELYSKLPYPMLLPCYKDKATGAPRTRPTWTSATFGKTSCFAGEVLGSGRVLGSRWGGGTTVRAQQQQRVLRARSCRSRDGRAILGGGVWRLLERTRRSRGRQRAPERR